MESCPAGHWQYEKCQKADGSIIEKRVPNPNDPAEAEEAKKLAMAAQETQEEDQEAK